MKLRGIEFGPCLDAPGVRGWVGEGYWFHRLQPFLFNFRGSTEVRKTATMYPTKGNMPLCGPEKLYAPKEFFPRCIWSDPRTGRTLNAIGLSGPGVRALAKIGYFRKEKNPNEPFMVSFMPVAKLPEERIVETRKFVNTIQNEIRLKKIRQPFGIQLNISCPNTGLDPNRLVHEATKELDIFASLAWQGYPILVKFNCFAPVRIVAQIADHSACDALVITNAPPFQTMLECVPALKEVFPDGSPLRRRNAQFGDGGYSGPELLPLVIAWIREARKKGIDKPICAGGGIRRAADVDHLVSEARLRPRTDSIFFASAPITLRAVQPITMRAHLRLG